MRQNCILMYLPTLLVYFSYEGQSARQARSRKGKPYLSRIIMLIMLVMYSLNVALLVRLTCKRLPNIVETFSLMAGTGPDNI